MKPKLPDLWVSFDDYGVEWSSTKKPDGADPHMTGPTHRYVPAEKAKVCIAKSAEYHWEVRVSCNDLCVLTVYKYCPYCGGKIKVKR